MADQRQDAEVQERMPGLLGVIERIGNRLPDPLTLFVILCVLVVLLSWVGATLGWQVTHPGTGEEVRAFTLVSREGIAQMLTEVADNIGAFFPLIGGIIIMLGIAMAERSGLASAALRRFALGINPKYMTLVVVFLGVSSSVASDVGFLLLPPLAGMLFYAVGRNPVVGILAAYAAVAAGFNASVFLGIVEVVGFALAEEAAHLLDPEVTIPVVSNYYFTFVSAFLLPVTAYFVTEKILVPRFGDYEPTDLQDETTVTAEEVTDLERRGLRWAAATAGLYVLAVLAMVLPPNAVLREPETGGLLESPLMEPGTQVALITLLFLLPGLAFGIATHEIRSDRDAAKMLTDGLASFTAYILIAMIAAQLIAYFDWSNLGVIAAVNGAAILDRLGLPALALLVAFIAFVCVLNIVMASAAAKWALISPIFVPMFMLLEIHPAAVYLGYRIGDSVTNAITPMLPYFIILLGFVQRYQRARIGTLVAALLPFAGTFLLVWLVQLALWYTLGLPLGPGVGFEFAGDVGEG